MYKEMEKLIVNGTMQLHRDLNPENHDPVCTSTQCPYRAASSSIVGTRLTANSPLSVSLHIKLPPPIQTGGGFLCVTFHTEQVSKTRKTEFVSFHWIISALKPVRHIPEISRLNNVPILPSSSPVVLPSSLRKHLHPQQGFLPRPPCYKQQFREHAASINFSSLVFEGRRMKVCSGCKG